MSNKILVVTHNGRLPADGGKRVGYLVDQIFFRFDGIALTAPIIFPIIQVKPADISPTAVPAKADSRIRYRFLPMSGPQGKCPFCDRGANPKLENDTIDNGVCLLVLCLGCGRVMKPYVPFRLRYPKIKN